MVSMLREIVENIRCKLSAEDKTPYVKVVTALKKTIRLMGEIDEAIEAAGGWPLK